ncbi:MAG TPA: glycosyltransferase family 4 protein [Tepidisphaeraceae bacterium]|jgi:glycosyltransferase involved in cell wall biosynthesis|nr:glycosyltransferase family 4 protein [Tepidisphaeraceae bacterium]
MRIGLVSYEYPPQRGLGGVGTYTFRLAGALGRAGHEVIVLAGPSEGAEFDQPNVTVHRLPARYDPPVTLRGVKFLYWRVFARLMDSANPLVWHWLRWDLASLPALAEIHRATPLDVIEAPEHAANGLFSGLSRNWPMVLRIHGPWDLFFGINRNDGAALNNLLANLEKQSLQYAQVTTVPSRSMSNFITRRWHLPQRPVVVPNFMDVPKFRPPLPDKSEPQRIVCAGRLERFKGQDVLVKAFAMIARKHPDAQLLLIGPDQWSRKQRFNEVIESLVPDKAIRSRIELRGPQPLVWTQEELKRAAIAVVPSTGFESFSFSTLEAMAAGRPTVVSRIGAMPELLDYGRCGIISSPGDAGELALALDRLLGDRELRETFAACAHERARDVYDTEAVLPEFVSTYELARERYGPVRGRFAEREDRLLQLI